MGKAVVSRGKMMEAIIATPASTPAGLRARAETLAALVALADAFGDEGETLEELARSEYKDGREQLSLSLARDVLAWRVAV